MGRKDPDADMIIATTPRGVRLGLLLGQDARPGRAAYHKPWWPSLEQWLELVGVATSAWFRARTRAGLPADMAHAADEDIERWERAVRSIHPAQMAAWEADWDHAFSDPEGMTEGMPPREAAQ